MIFCLTADLVSEKIRFMLLSDNFANKQMSQRAHSRWESLAEVETIVFFFFFPKREVTIFLFQKADL